MTHWPRTGDKALPLHREDVAALHWQMDLEGTNTAYHFEISPRECHPGSAVRVEFERSGVLRMFCDACSREVASVFVERKER